MLKFIPLAFSWDTAFEAFTSLMGGTWDFLTGNPVLLGVILVVAVAITAHAVISLFR